jgi:hypothetical protein
VSTTTVYEAGLTCDAEDCGAEFVLGEEMLFWYGRKLHPRCASKDAAARRGAAGEDGDVLDVARRHLEEGGRIILTRRQLRALVARAQAADAGFTPVRKPDAGTGRRQWYGRMPGWAAERVAAGLSAAEAAGMWLDFMDAGRLPPLRSCDVAAVLAVTGAVTAA